MTGAIFARGSCRALKWMALLGVVFALGVGQAAAQIEYSGEKGVKGDEGGRVKITMTAEITVAAGQSTTQTVTIPAPEGNITDVTVDNIKMLSPADGTGGADDYSLPAATTLTIPGNPSSEKDLETEVTHTFEIQLQSDTDAEDEVFNVVFGNLDTTSLTADSVTGLDDIDADDRTRTITINDTDDQEFVWKVIEPAKPNEEDDTIVTLTAEPTPRDLSYTTALNVDKAGYTLSPSSWTFDAAIGTTDPVVDGPMVRITIEPPDSDKNRDPDTIMVNAFVAGTATSRVPALEIEIADIHALPMADKISAMAFEDDGEGKASKTETMSVMEGGDPVHVTVTVDRGTTGYPSGEALEVSVMADASQALDYRVDRTMITVASGMGEKKATFKLWALKDDDVGAEDLMLTLTAMGADDDNGPGEVMQMFSIAIEDDTTAKVWAKDGAKDAIYGARSAAAGDDEMINPGENFEIMTDDLFGHLPTVTVAYAASSDNSAVGVSASGEKIMVMPQDMAGTAKITVTATATDKASSFKPSQDRSDVAHIMFEVAVVMPDLMITLSSEDENIVEGGMGAKVTATANRAVDEDTMVMLMRDRSESTAGDDDYTAEPITIMKGEMMGYTMVMAVEDDMMENMNNMPEELVLYGMAGDMQVEGDVHLHIWDAAVPALPIIAQLLLAALLGLGGYRRYRRR